MRSREDAEKVCQPVLFIWSVQSFWSVSFIWLFGFSGSRNKTNQIDQSTQMDQTDRPGLSQMSRPSKFWRA